MQDLRLPQHLETLDSICQELDLNTDWQVLGQTINIPDTTLQRIGTGSVSCTKTVLDIIEKRTPELTVNEMQAALREMRREDVCRVLNNYLPGNNVCWVSEGGIGITTSTEEESYLHC